MPILGTIESSNRQKIKIGDLGPGNGIVFYDAGSTQSWGRYMEIAVPATEVFLKWSRVLYGTVVGTSASLGTGYTNTNAILALDPVAPKASYCDTYTQNGYSDWCLPSIGDLQQLVNLQNKINLRRSNYIFSAAGSVIGSSSEDSIYTSIYYSLYNIVTYGSGYDSKDTTGTGTFPVRYF